MPSGFAALNWSLRMACGPCRSAGVRRPQLRVFRRSAQPFGTSTSGEPVAALFEGKEHRPEIIVEDADADVVLVVEAKARLGLDRADAEAFLYPLLQWQPRAALLANYFAVNHAPPLTETSQGDSALASSSDCQPIGAGAESVRSWLRRQCAQLLPSPTRVIVVDVSSSMPADDAEDVVRALADDAHVARYVAFAERAALNRGRTLVRQARPWRRDRAVERRVS